MDARGSGRWPTLLAALGLGLLGRALIGSLREADLRGAVALVTGGSRGLGFLLARDLARAGCHVAICARDAHELGLARDALRADGAEVLAVRCDVTDRAQVERFVDETIRRLGRVDICVNNAGVIQVGPVEAMALEDFEHAMAVMFWGVVYPTLAVLPSMLARGGGRIVNITSIGGKVSVPHLLPYASAKFAAVGFSEGLRAEMARHGVQVTTVVPGLMRTGSYLGALFKGRQREEFTWFSVAASLPGLSMDAERAARAIVRAIRRGAAEVTLGLPALGLARAHGLFPGSTTDMLGLVNRLLPRAAGGAPSPVRGYEMQPVSPVLTSLTRLGAQAAARYQHGPRSLER